MKIVLFTIISFAICLTISGQQISLSSNRYRGSDVLEKKQVEVNYVIAGRFFCYKLKECDILHITKEPSRCYKKKQVIVLGYIIL